MTAVHLSRVTALLVTAALLFVAGCRGPSAADALAAANNTSLKRLSNLYVAFQSRNDWKGPADEAELRSFILGWNPRKLANIGVDPAEIDELFVSARDGEPFQIRYGVPGHVLGSEAPVVFESTGVDGKRMVGFLNMTTMEVDEAEYSRLWSGEADEVNASTTESTR